MAILNTVAQFGRYILRSRVAETSAFEVWIAEIDGAGEGTPPVVFKKLRTELAQNVAIFEAFTARARRAMRLKHDCIAQVLDVVVNRNDCGLAIEYVDGKTLRQLIRAVGGADNALPVWFAIHVARCICQALELAHSMNDENGRPQPVVHGALTAENVYLTFLGQVKVADFGIGQRCLVPASRDLAVSTEHPHVTPTSLVESATADLEAVGCILYELLTGISPDCTDSKGRAFLPPSHYAQWINAEVDQLLSRILSPKDPKPLRTATELRKALDDYLSVRRHEVTATHIAGLVTVLFSEECRESAPPTARIHENAVELAIRRSRRTSPPDIDSFESPTLTGFKPPTHTIPPNSQFTRQTVPSPAVSPSTKADPQVEVPQASNRQSGKSLVAAHQPERPPEAVESHENRSGPFHHDWDLALKRAREEVQANQRASGAFPTNATVTRPEPPVDPAEQAVREFERGLEHMRHSEFDAALKSWERALEFDPQHRVCRANLNLLKKKLGNTS
ncbi:MAG: serine/threonine protein kinase [Myxococcales bacterium]